MNDEPSKIAAHGTGQSPPVAGNVPVYNCHARLSMPDAEGWITARCCNLADVVGRGKTQREALAALVAAFKAVISRYSAASETIPWTDPPAKAEPGEQERWIAVHL